MPNPSATLRPLRIGARRRSSFASLIRPGDVATVFEADRLERLWQDEAGTIAVTAAGASVQRVNDGSGGNRHATQANTAAAPVLGRHPAGGARNLLLATDALATQSRTVTAVPHTLSFMGTGQITLSGASTAGPLVGTGNRVSLTFTPAAGSLVLTVTGSVTLGQLELGAAATAYQRVVGPYDVSEAGKQDCWYLLGDGSDNHLVTPTFAWGSGQAYIIAAVEKRGDGATGIIAEFSTNVNSSIGAWALAGPLGGGTNNFAGYSKGTLAHAAWANAGNNTSPSPARVVLELIADIAADRCWLYIDGVLVSTVTVDQGTGIYGSFAMYLLKRGALSQAFNGALYKIATFNRILSDAERYIARRIAAAAQGRSI